MRSPGGVAFPPIPRLIATIFAVSALAFGLITLIPGAPALVLLGVNDLTPQSIAEVHHKPGLDLPLPLRSGLRAGLPPDLTVGGEARGRAGIGLGLARRGPDPQSARRHPSGVRARAATARGVHAAGAQRDDLDAAGRVHRDGARKG